MSDHATPFDPPAAIAAVMARVYGRRLTTASGGNVSTRGEDGSTWITPAALDKGDLHTADVVRVRSDGTTDGSHRASSELPFHAAVYAARPDVGAIVHAHPVTLVAFSICHVVPDTTMLAGVHTLCGDVVSVPYECTGTERLGARIAETFASGANAALLENHGAVVAGRDLAEAFARFETLEWTARIAVRTHRLNADRTVSRPGLTTPRPATAPADGPPACIVAAPDDADARSVRATAGRIYERGLAPGRGGAVSLRLDGGAILITMPGSDLARLGPADVVRLDQSSHPPDADDAGALHAAIHAAHPDVAVVITARPVCATSLGLAGVPLDTRFVSESYLVLREVATLPGSAAAETVRAGGILGPARPAALWPGVGVVTLGGSLLEAFDRLEVLEATAEALIEADSVGRPARLDEGDLADLHALIS